MNGAYFENNKIYSTYQVCERLEITKPTLYWYIKTGLVKKTIKQDSLKRDIVCKQYVKLKVIKVGQYKILGSDLNSFMEEAGRR